MSESPVRKCRGLAPNLQETNMLTISFLALYLILGLLIATAIALTLTPDQDPVCPACGSPDYWKDGCKCFICPVHGTDCPGDQF